MNQSQLYTLAVQAGLPTSKATIAAAIAMAESGGNPNAHNTKGKDDSYGLWQINMKGSLGPARRTQFGLSNDAQLLDPTTNAKAMSEISKNGQNFSAWTTYTSDAYKKYLSNNVSVVDLTPGGVISGLITDNALGDAVSSARTVAAALIKTGAWVSDTKNWIRVAFIIGGGVVVITGLLHLAQPYLEGQLGKAASLVGPGKIAKVATAVKGKASAN